MYNYKLLLLLFISLVAFSCNKVAKKIHDEVEERHHDKLKENGVDYDPNKKNENNGVPYNLNQDNQIDKKTYQSPYAKALLNKRLILSFKTPEGFKKMNTSETSKIVAKGQKAIGNQTNEQTLLGLKKDDKNQILISKVKLPLSLTPSFKRLKENEQATLNAYQRMGIPAKLEQYTHSIDGLMFNKALITLYQDEAKQNPALYQTMYTRIEEGELISIVISASDILSSVQYQTAIQGGTIR